jgi:hypothetical protein
MKFRRLVRWAKVLDFEVEREMALARRRGHDPQACQRLLRECVLCCRAMLRVAAIQQEARR